MTVVYIILSLTVILTILSCVAARKFADTLVHAVVRTYEEARNRVLECCEIDPYSTLEGHKTEPFTYRSEFGYDLQGKIIRANETREDGKERKQPRYNAHLRQTLSEPWLQRRRL